MEATATLTSLTKIEYLTTFNAFIYGYIVNRFFSNWGKIISNRKNVTFSLEHILWSVFAFLMLVGLWWDSWLHIDAVKTQSRSFYASIISPIIIYMISSLYFPVFTGLGIVNLGRDALFQRKQSAILYSLLYLYLLVKQLIDPTISGRLPYYMVGVVVSLVVFFNKVKWISRSALLIGFGVLIVYLIKMPEYNFTDKSIIQGFYFSEYLATFVTFIYGFIIARFLDGWSFFVVNRRSIRFNVDYILWTVLIFGLIIDYWWGLWGRVVTSSNNFASFILSLFVPICFSMLTSLLFPDLGTDKQIGQEALNNNHKLVFTAFIGIFFFDFLAAILVNSREIIHIENLFLLLAIMLCGWAVAKPSLIFQRIVLALAWILLIVHNAL